MPDRKEIKVIQDLDELKAWRRSVGGTVGFVPTMGALHAGHAALMRQIRPRCEQSVVSIFVNPTQFAPGEDFEKYPRTQAEDMRVCREEKVDVIFAPSAATLFPTDFSTYVEETQLSQELCGRFRPGHFRGVTTVVLKLFQLVRPQLALFGFKDAQQFFVLHKMGKDLNLDTQVSAIATVREADGLALSSRNRYLSGEDRRLAPRLYQELKRAGEKLEAGEPIPVVLARAREMLANAGFRVQYLECMEAPELVPAQTQTAESGRSYLVAAAAFLGATRLIDNVLVHPEALARSGIRLG
ncbi:MAG: pantoate--beta-alanine ligase [Bacteriovoracia bacterium]